MENEIATIILNYRQAKLTARCVSSLIGQVRLIVIVDNSADDAENEKLSVYLASMRSKIEDATLEVVNPGTNLGFARGVQCGLDRVINHSEYRAVLIINNDAVAHAGMVERMVQTLDMHERIALIAPQTSGSSTSPIMWYHRHFGLVLKRSLPGAFSYLSGSCLLVPVSLLWHKLFDPNFFMYGEDVELSWRMTQAGVPLVIANAECHHVGSASSRNGSLFYEYHVVRGHILLARKLSKDLLDRVGLLIGRAISLPLRATLRCIRHKNLNPWRGLVLACLGKPPPGPVA